MKRYPALEIRSREDDLVIAALDDFSPTAIEEQTGGLRAFFDSIDARDAALQAMASRFGASPIDVPDDDWARRSQEGLEPVTVGRITILPSPDRIPDPESPITIVIAPSMGFGTGHHATTRLCLEALQSIDLRNAVVLDVGTGSGVLAIAADRLGAARAIGIDSDPDAIQSARENLDRNRVARHVTFEVADAREAELPVADVLTANLTGALLIRCAGALWNATRSGGTLVLSGLMLDERDAVLGALPTCRIIWEREEDGWSGLAMKKS